MIIKYIIGGIFRLFAIPLVVRCTYAKNKVSILHYHDPPKSVFEKHMLYLSKRYNFISLDDLVQSIYSRNFCKLPPRSLVITFDDGHRGNYQLIDLFDRHNIKPTIYVCTEIVNTDRKFWFKNENINIDNLKKVNNMKRKKILLHENCFHEEKEYDTRYRQGINLDEMNKMKNIVDFQSHTSFHPILTACTDYECWNEIFDSKNKLEKMTGDICKHFAYPNGDYSQREIELLKKAGYSSARTTRVGWNDLSTNPFELKVVGADDNASVNWLSVQMCGLLHLARGYLYKR